MTRPASPRWPVTPRDMPPSPFAAVLERLIARVPGARAAALVDDEGETVDYAGALTPFDAKIAAAHLRILLCDLDRLGVLGTTKELVIRGPRRSLVARALPAGYAFVLVLARGAGSVPAGRAFAVAEEEFSREARLPITPARCQAVEVDEDDRGRPRGVRDVDAGNVEVTVLGAVPRGRRPARAFRVRLGTGEEITLVREAPGSWFAEDGER